jgi:hypothetical protein
MLWFGAAFRSDAPPHHMTRANVQLIAKTIELRRY